MFMGSKNHRILRGFIKDKLYEMEINSSLIMRGDFIMRIYIVGSVASGKTTLTKKLSNRLGIKCTHLDGIIHIKDKTNKEWGNISRTDEEINLLFKSIIMKPHWVIEDAGRKIFSKIEFKDPSVFLIYHGKKDVADHSKKVSIEAKRLARVLL